MRDHFDMDPSQIYLNSGTHSIAPRSVRQAVQNFQNEFEKNPTMGLREVWPRLWQGQKELGAFLNADPNDLFFRPNITAALNAFILGVPLPRDGEILVGPLEYGAIVNLCTYRAQQDGLSVRTLKIGQGGSDYSRVTRQELIDSVVSQLKADTRVLLLSHVATTHGLVFPIEEISKETRKRGVLLVVDGAHAPGALPLDFAQFANVDFYGGNLHKWMMGPKGTSFGWVPKRHQDSLKLIQAGWTTFETDKEYTPYSEAGRFQGRMLLSACYDFSPYMGVSEMIAFWKRLDPNAIRKRQIELKHQVVAQVRETLGWKRLTPEDETLWGPLTLFLAPKEWQKAPRRLMDEIQAKHRLQIATIILPTGEFCVRFSPHIYNTGDEISRAVRILKEFRPEPALR